MTEQWRMSPYEDHRAHLFRQVDGETATALCETSFPTDQLGDATDPKCVICVLVHGHELDEARDDDLDDWGM